MNPSIRTEALEILLEVVELSSDVRLGQLFAHLGFLGEDQTGRTLWDLEDEQFLSVLQHHLEELKIRMESPRLDAACVG